ncbi:DUF5610 domain-containing protein [Nitrincola alkalilacustris]|uniref:DUF5610 domain-containing protein n=1 Tax=Nitrincola alkalilacustris TaxID=1571224 RepID=UPI00124DE0EA|nr:DUF5610 domain-containing protein [Nitrincola alkalilacustris]
MISINSPFAKGSQGLSNPGQKAHQPPGVAAGLAHAAKSGNGPGTLSAMHSFLLEKLATKIPGMDAGGFKKLDANEFTPEKVADRISKFVAAGLEQARARGDSEEKVQALYERAMKGVEQGFAEAKEILSGLNLLNGGIKDQVAETEKLTFEALEALSPNGKNAALVGTMGMSVAERYQRADSFELTLNTREGDKVTINFNRAVDYSATAAVAADDQGNSVSRFDISRSESTGFSFTIEGDLNEDEIDAIQNLIRDVSQLADEFYNGDIQKAFEQASNLSFDGTQLASMDLKMMRVEQYSAASQYQQTEQLDQPQENRGAQLLEQLMQELYQQFNNSMLSFLEDSRSAGASIMQALAEQDTRFKDADADQKSRYQDNLERLLGAVNEAP